MIRKRSQGTDRLAKPLCCHINLIPVNPIKERDYVQSDTKHIQAFKNKLESKMIHVTIRREMGRDIDGACGQLRQPSYAGGRRTRGNSHRRKFDVLKTFSITDIGRKRKSKSGLYLYL